MNRVKATIIQYSNFDVTVGSIKIDSTRTKEQFEEPAFIHLMTRKPCFNCGQDDHELLIRGRTRCKSSGLTYGCPFVIYEDIYINRQEVNLQYYMCPKLLAQKYDYNIDEVSKALWWYNREGVGRFIDLIEKEKFYEHMQNLCTNMKRSYTFKRQVLTEKQEDKLNGSESDTSMLL